MAGGRRRWASNGSGNSGNKRFFKIILPSTIEDKKLLIPVKFVRNHGAKLSDVAVLTLPDDRVWRVGLTKADGNIWLENGWPELVEHYSISSGHFVVFKYKGDNNFKVHIFDMTACEVQYPINEANRGAEPSKHRQCSMVDVKMESEEDDIIEIEECNPHQRKGSSRKEKAHFSTKFGSMTANGSDKGDSQNLPREEVNIITGRRFYKIYSEATQASKRAIDAAKRFKPRSPSFMVVMRSYNIHNGLVYVPMEFVEKYLRESSGYVKLRSPDGKEWPVHMNLENNRNPFLTSGWGEFAREYLEEGDACIFELIMPHTDTMKASIFHARSCKTKIHQKNPASVGTSNFESINDRRTRKCKKVEKVPSTHDANESEGGKPIKKGRFRSNKAGGEDMGGPEVSDLNAADTGHTAEFILKATIFRASSEEKHTDDGN